MSYLKQHAAPWVSVAVLAGGLISAGLLFWIVKIQAEFHFTITSQ